MKKGKPKIGFLIGKYKNDLKLTYPQAKRRYNLRPYSDSDFDGTLNLKDCKPLNPAQDGIISAIGALVKRKGWKAAKKELKKPGIIRRKIGRRIAEGRELKRMKRRVAVKEVQKEVYKKYGLTEKRGKKEVVLKKVPSGVRRPIGKLVLRELRKRKIEEREKRFKPIRKVVKKWGKKYPSIGRKGKKVKGQKKSVGRPKGVYIHTSPITV